MAAANPDYEVEERLEELERRLAATAAVVSRSELRLEALEGIRAARLPLVRLDREREPAHCAPRAAEAREIRSAPPPAPSGSMPAARRDRVAWTDFLGGRALAWLGGITTLLGIVLLLALAISHGWIGPVMRVALAGAASVGLFAAGIWLHARRGRTEAAVTMVGTATAGSFATLVAATEMYHLIPALAGVGGAMLAGAVATGVAIRWAGRVVAGLGLVGSMLAPVLVGAPVDAAAIAMLAVATTYSMWVVLWRRWPLLALAAVLVPAPQWATWVLRGQGALAEVTVLAVFGLLALVGAVFTQLRSRQDDSLAVSAAAIALLGAAIIGATGRIALGQTAGGACVGAVAVAYAVAGLWRWPRLAIHATLRRLLLAVAVVAGDCAIGMLVHGVAMSAAWGAGAVGFAWLVRRGSDEADAPWLGVALGEHIGLVLVRGLIELPPSQLSGTPELSSVFAIAILAALCLGSARVTDERWALWRRALDALGLLTIAYLTAATLGGVALVGAWVLEAVALAGLARRTEDRTRLWAAIGFLSLAGLYATVTWAPPSALIRGVDGLLSTCLALGAVAFGTVFVGVTARDARARALLLSGAGFALLYLGSVAIVTVFQPTAGTVDDTLLSLSVRQQGQVVLSALWSAIGVLGLIVGLRRDFVRVRMAALGWLLVTVAKVFLYDLSMLTSIYRVLSFLVLGALLLGGAFAYQRLRPPAAPDLRTVHPSQR